MLFTVHHGRERTLLGFVIAPKRGDVEAHDHRNEAQ
jgi:hypothetical protein